MADEIPAKPISDAEIEALLKPSEPGIPFADPLQAKSTALEQHIAARPENYQKNFIAENQQLDVPLDVESGAPFWQRVRGSFRDEPEQKMKFWQDLYGQGNLRPAIFQGKPTGGLIVRALDEATGKPKDVLVNEDHLSIKDFGEMAGALPELAGSIGATLAGRKIGALAEAPEWIKGLRDIFTSSLGGQTAKELKKVAVSGADQVPYDISEAPGNIAVGTVKDAVMGGVLGLLGKAGAKIITPFGDAAPPINVQGKEGVNYLESRFGEKVPLSPGEKTGQPLLQRVESEMPKLPGGSKGYEDLRQEQDTVFGRILDRIRGLPAGATKMDRLKLPSDQEVGEQLTSFIRGQNQPVDLAVESARRRLLSNQQKIIEDTLNKATIPERQLYRDKIGGMIRAKAQDVFDQFKAKTDLLYEQATSLPGGKDRILIDPKLPGRAAKYLEKELPSKEVISEVPTGVLDAQGNPILRTETGKEVLKEFIPSNVIGKLKELASVGDTKFSLQDLISMRNEVANDIAVGEAVPGVQTRHLKKIRDMLTGAIKDSTGAIPDQKLRNAWEVANNTYADEVKQFHTPLVSSLLKPQDAPGFLGDAAIVKRIMAGEDNIQEAKKFLGPTSREYQVLKRGIADHVFEGSLIPGTTKLDAQSFIRNMESLRLENRSAFNEVFGNYGNQLIEQSKVLGLGKRGVKLDVEMIDKDIRNPFSVPHLRELLDATKQQESLYDNQIRKMIGSKSFPANQIRPSELTDWIINKGQLGDVQAIMRGVESQPELRDRVRQKVVESLLSDAARNPTKSDLVALRLDPERIINSDRLIQALGSPEKQKIYESVLGKETMTDLENVAKAVRPIEQKQGRYSAAGGLAGGLAVAGFLRGGVSGFVEKALKHKVISTMLTMKPTREWLGNEALSPNAQKNIVGGFIMSAPFIDSLVEDYGKAGAEHVARYLANQVSNIPNAPASTGQPAQKNPLSQQEIDRLLQGVRPK